MKNITLSASRFHEGIDSRSKQITEWVTQAVEKVLNIGAAASSSVTAEAESKKDAETAKTEDKMDTETAEAESKKDTETVEAESKKDTETAEAECKANKTSSQTSVGEMNFSFFFFLKLRF